VVARRAALWWREPSHHPHPAAAAFKVRVRAVTTDGRVVSDDRTYRTCAPERRKR